jgi:sulfur transfer complex TusBCD TusB component (DsrH family)
MSNLSPEKEFTHMMFCQQIQNIDLDAAKQLLTELHLLYLGQQAVFAKIAKNEFLGGI